LVIGIRTRALKIITSTEIRLTVQCLHFDRDHNTSFMSLWSLRCPSSLIFLFQYYIAKYPPEGDILFIVSLLIIHVKWNHSVFSLIFLPADRRDVCLCKGVLNSSCYVLNFVFSRNSSVELLTPTLMVLEDGSILRNDYVLRVEHSLMELFLWNMLFVTYPRCLPYKNSGRRYQPGNRSWAWSNLQLLCSWLENIQISFPELWEIKLFSLWELLCLWYFVIATWLN
jgi:hypothetical protein